MAILSGITMTMLPERMLVRVHYLAHNRQQAYFFCVFNWSKGKKIFAPHLASFPLPHHSGPSIFSIETWKSDLRVAAKDTPTSEQKKVFLSAKQQQQQQQIQTLFPQLWFETRASDVKHFFFSLFSFFTTRFAPKKESILASLHSCVLLPLKKRRYFLVMAAARKEIFSQMLLLLLLPLSLSPFFLLPFLGGNIRFLHVSFLSIRRSTLACGGKVKNLGRKRIHFLKK